MLDQKMSESSAPTTPTTSRKGTPAAPARIRLEELCPDGHVPAVLVLGAAARARPVLPDDPLEVEHLERDQRDGPHEDSGRGHLRTLPAASRGGNGPFGPIGRARMPSRLDIWPA